MSLSVAIITKNEEANIGRTLESVKWADEIVVVDSGSTDRTCEIAREYGAKVFVEEWKGFAKQKNSAIDKCTGDWILSLDADEEVSGALAAHLRAYIQAMPLFSRLPNVTDVHEREALVGQIAAAFGDELDEYGDYAHRTIFDIKHGMPTAYFVHRRNSFLGRWMKHGGFYPDPKVRFFRRDSGRFADRLVHEDVEIRGRLDSWVRLNGHLIHHAYPTLSGYIEHMNRYSDLSAEMVVEKKGKVLFSFINIVLRPLLTFVYNYFLRLGFLDGKEGLLLHLYHSVYVSWKYAKAWELSRKKPTKA